MSLEAEMSPSFLLETPCEDETSKDARAAPRSASAAGSLGEPAHEIDAADGGHATVPREIGNKEEDEEHHLLGDIESIQVGQTVVVPLLFHVISPPHLSHLSRYDNNLFYRSLSVCVPCWQANENDKSSRSSNVEAVDTPRTIGGKDSSQSAPRHDGASVARK